jgi:glutamate dehydrogenase/leucine dehydrogenase
VSTLTAVGDCLDALAAGLAGPGVFGALDLAGHEEVIHCADPATQLRAIIAIHSTALGPALGGVRLRPYRSEAQALADVLQLSRTMTYKAALAGLDHGGGKSVIIGDPAHRSEALLRMFARFVDSLGGRYITAEDLGLTLADIDVMRAETPFVAGCSPAWGGIGSPSCATAAGVLAAMRAAVERRLGARSLEQLHVAVMGAGKVGAKVVEGLVADGARVTVADIDPPAAAAMLRQFGVAAAAPETIHAVECDVFAPCALGGILSSTTVAQLRCAVVVGSANNQLAEAADAHRLAERGILYVPDYAANAGGLIHVAAEVRGTPANVVPGLVARVEDTCRTVLAEADAGGITPSEAADRIAERRLREVGSLKTLHRRCRPGSADHRRDGGDSRYAYDI